MQTCKIPDSLRRSKRHIIWSSFTFWYNNQRSNKFPLITYRGTIWRTGLWRKLQNCEIKGKCFKMIYYMYNDIKSCVQYNSSYMIYIIRNPIFWLGIRAYGGGVFVSLFFDRRCSPDYFFRNVNKMAAWIPDKKKDKKQNVYC